LEEAIEERRTGMKKEVVPEVEISLTEDAYIPDSYIADGYQKIQMYKRVKNMETAEEMIDLQDELIDRFGDLPIEAEQLLRIARMKVWARAAGVESIKQQGDRVTIKLSDTGTEAMDGGKVVEASGSYGRAVGFTMNGQALVLNIDGKKTGKHHPFDVLEGMMEILADSVREEASVD